MTGSLPGRLAIFALDAGDPALLARWLADGTLPAIAAVSERGAWGETGGAELVSEHGVWTSLFSGVSRGRHGHYYFRELEPGTYDLRAAEAVRLGVAPFWSALAGTSARAVVVDVPDAPFVPGLAGVQLRDWGTHQGWDPGRYPVSSEPPERAAEIVSRHGPQLRTIEELDTGPARDRELLREILSRVARRGALVRELVAGEQPHLLVATFAESHAAAHQFWSYQRGLPGGRDGGPELAEALRSVYQAIDREIGLIIAELPPGTSVSVVSSVGLADQFPTAHLIEDFLRTLGYEVPSEPGRLSLRPLDLVRRALPERLRRAAASRLSRETRERLLADVFRRRTDWSRTRAFAIPSPYTSFVRLNLRGREPQGLVEPGAEADALLSELAHELASLRDADTGEPVVRQVGLTKELFGSGASERLPDMFVTWVSGRMLGRVDHPRAVLVNRRPDFFRRSDHTHAGFFAIAGPGIAARGRLGTIDVLDLAPTFLDRLGLEPPPGLTGRPLDLGRAGGRRPEPA